MSRWIWGLADNGWVDWICPECGWRYNDDIHVTLDYKYCPNCGACMVDLDDNGEYGIVSNDPNSILFEEKIAHIDKWDAIIEDANIIW